MTNVVLLHGFPLSSAMWRQQADALAAAGHAVLLTDLPGFGTTSVLDAPPAMSAMADWVSAQMELLGMDSAVVVGLSMGGYVAMELLRRNPAMVSALVLCDTKASADGPEARANRERIAEAVLEAGSTRSLARTMPETLLGEGSRANRPDLIDRVTEWIDSADPRAVAWAQRAMAARHEAFDVLASAQIPTMIIWGSQDVVSVRADQEAMLEAAPHARFEVVESAGHLSSVEQPDRVSTLLLEFVGSL
jgi:pimeloyl-ACP methyl ester carboxylesterase